MPLSLAQPEQDRPSALTEPPKTSRPSPDDRFEALVRLAAGDPAPPRLTLAAAELAAEGWTRATAYASLTGTGPVLRVVDGGGRATKPCGRLTLVPARPVLRLAAAS